VPCSKIQDKDKVRVPEGHDSDSIFAALEMAKSNIEVKLNLVGKEMYSQKISVNKNLQVKDFREKIQNIIGLPLDDFKIKLGNNYELVDGSALLSDVGVCDGTYLTIEQGKPSKDVYTFELLDLTKDGDSCIELLQIDLPKDILISGIKEIVLPLLQKKGLAVTNSTHIRLRHMFSLQQFKSVGMVFQDSLMFTKATFHTSSKCMAVQILSEPEQLKDQENEICFFVQQFKPSTFELTRKEDFIISCAAALDQLRVMLATRYGIEPANLGIIRVGRYNFYHDPDLLEVPEMGWDTFQSNSFNTVKDAMLSNGDLMLFRDNTEKLKTLTKEEKRTIKKKQRK